MPIDQFAKEMQELAAQAALAPQAEPSPIDPPENVELANAVGRALQPLSDGLESLRTGVAESNRVLARLAKEIEPAEGAATEDPAERITRTLESIQAQVQRMGQVESANLRLFDALHAELKGYKDNFLFDALQKPFVRDLITLYSDDLGVVQQQIEKRFETLPETANPERDFLSKLTMNLENTLAHFYEVLVRMEVEPYESAEGSAVDLKRHRAISVEPAMLPDHDGRIVRSLKQGFLWRERVIRPEEVVVCKWPAGREPSAE